MDRSWLIATVVAVIAVFTGVIMAVFAMGKPPDELGPEPAPLPDGPTRSADGTVGPSSAPTAEAGSDDEAAPPTGGSRPSTGDRSEADGPAGSEGEGDAADGADEEAVPDRSIWPISRDGIRGAMNESLPAIQECYEGWLAQNPDLSGRIEVTFSIAPADTGTDVAAVQGVDIADSNIGHAFMEGCVLSVVEELRFEGSESVDVNYPFEFKSLEE